MADEPLDDADFIDPGTGRLLQATPVRRTGMADDTVEAAKAALIDALGDFDELSKADVLSAIDALIAAVRADCAAMTLQSAAQLVGFIDNAPEDMAEHHKRYLYGIDE